MYIVRFGSCGGGCGCGGGWAVVVVAVVSWYIGAVLCTFFIYLSMGDPGCV